MNFLSVLARLHLIILHFRWNSLMWGLLSLFWWLLWSRTTQRKLLYHLTQWRPVETLLRTYSLPILSRLRSRPKIVVFLQRWLVLESSCHRLISTTSLKLIFLRILLSPSTISRSLSSKQRHLSWSTICKQMHFLILLVQRFNEEELRGSAARKWIASGRVPEAHE